MRADLVVAGGGKHKGKNEGDPAKGKRERREEEKREEREKNTTAFSSISAKVERVPLSNEGLP